MKKYNLKFFVIQMAIIVGISLAVGLFFGLRSNSPLAMIILLTGFFTFLISIFYFFVYGSVITDRFTMRTEKKYSEERGYADCETFYSNSEILKINEKDGKIAYIANQNPFEFQEVSAADISGIRTGYIKGPLGGTSYVYFEFVYKGKKKRIATFTSNSAYSMNSEEVVEGISKADYFCEVLNNAKANATA